MTIRSAGAVENHHLAVDHCRAAAQLAGSLDNRAIEVGPIDPITVEGTRCAVLENEQRSVAIELDLVNPPLTLRRLEDQRRKASIANKLTRATLSAHFLLASLAAIKVSNVRLEDL